MKLENVGLDMLGKARRSPSPRTTPPSSMAPARSPRSRAGSRRSGADRGHHLGLRQGEAAGAAGEARRRCCDHPRRRCLRDRGEGAQGPRRRCAARDPRRGAGGCRRRWRRGAGARLKKLQGLEGKTTTRPPASRSSARRCRRRRGRSPRTPVSTAQSSPARSWNRRRTLRLQRPDRRVWRHVQVRRDRPGQGRPHRVAGRRFGRRPAHHHRGDDHRQARAEGRAPAVGGGMGGMGGMGGGMDF